LISGPVSSALLPRMVTLEANGDQAGLVRVYRQATQLVAVLAGATSITLAFFAEPLLWAWTGDRQLARQAAPILALYGLGNAIFTVAAFPYYLQFAKGDLRLHMIGNAAFVVLLVPLIIWAASKYGGVGAGYVWLGMNMLSLTAWLPLVHKKFAPGINRLWYSRDVGIILLTTSIVGLCASRLVSRTESRFAGLLEIIACGAVLLMAGGTASSAARLALSSRLTTGSDSKL